MSFNKNTWTKDYSGVNTGLGKPKGKGSKKK